jgi:hypothetical protein
MDPDERKYKLMVKKRKMESPWYHGNSFVAGIVGANAVLVIAVFQTDRSLFPKSCFQCGKCLIPRAGPFPDLRLPYGAARIPGAGHITSPLLGAGIFSLAGQETTSQCSNDRELRPDLVVLKESTLLAVEPGMQASS